MIYAIGDVHGKSSMLTRALVYLSDKLLSPDDTVVFLGDYIDRGEDSKGVFNALRNFEASHEKCVFLRGNHEDLFLTALQQPATEIAWYYNGGLEMLMSYNLQIWEDWRNKIPAEDIEFMKNTKMEWAGSYFQFVHAGFVPEGVTPNIRAGLDPRLWIRDEFIQSYEDFGKVVVFGHTVQLSWLPLVMPNKIGIDTGAAFGGCLSVAGFDDTVQPGEWPDFTLFQVGADGGITILEWINED